MQTIRFKNGSSPVRINNIFCIGRNYAEHARELNNPIPSEPIIFLKPSSAVINSGGAIHLPAQSKDVHHEVEVVVTIATEGKNITEADALGYVKGYGIGIDVTARDIQSTAKAKGHPWSVAKGFDTFAPLSDFVDAGQIDDPAAIDLLLKVNGNIRQKGNTRDLLFPIPRLVAYLSTIFTLGPGDLIFTGTPEGVSQLNNGDRLEAVLGNGLADLQISVRR